MPSSKEFFKLDLKNKLILVRVDLNLPIVNGVVQDETRLQSVLPTIQEIIKKGGKVVLCSHFGRPNGEYNKKYSLKPLIEPLSKALNCPIVFSPTCIGPEAEELKNNLENNLKSQYENGIKQIEKKQLMDVLDKEHQFDLPQGIVDQEFSDIWHRIEHAKKDNKLDDDDKKLTDDKLKKRYEKISKRRVKLSILLQFIAKEQKISVDEKELTNGMMAYASQYPGQEKQIIEYFKKNPSAIETVRGPILEEKVINSVISSSNIVKKKITKTEYENLEKKTFDVSKD